MSKFFDELMESVKEINEIVRAERQRSREFNVEALQVNEIRKATGLTQVNEGQRTMHLTPNFPDDHTMHLLMQLLHEELGLPERKTISLTTSINFDLGCDGADARHLMESMEEQFAIDFIDYDAYRYFQPEGFDVFLKRRAKGRGDKIPLTIGMLYQAIKAQWWNTEELERIQPNA